MRKQQLLKMDAIRGYTFTVTVLLVVCFVTAVDRTTFKNCAQSDFCNRLRTRPPERAYNIDVNSMTFKNSSLSMVMHHKTKEMTLNVTIFLIKGYITRVMIHEVNTTRYNLQGVFHKGLRLVTVNFTENDEKATLWHGHYSVISYKESMRIEVCFKNHLLAVLNGKDRLVYENEDGKRAVAFDIQFPEAKRLYGIAGHGEKLALRTTNPGGSDPYRLYNLNVAEYELESQKALYGSVPMVFAHSEKHTSAVFIHNAAEQWVEISHNPNGEGMEAYFMVESGVIDMFFEMGPTPTQMSKQYTSMTGVTPLPPLWALGYHQSGCRYDSSSDVKGVISELDNNNYPVDAIWLGSGYTNQKRYFSWDPVKFQDPKEMLANLSSTNRKLAVTIAPQIKVDLNYEVYKGLKERGYFVKYPNGTDFEGVCWPGLSTYLDFFNPEAADHYASWYAYDQFKGTDPTLAGIWNDFNEPSVVDNSLENTMPKNLVHSGGVAHRDVHNIYGMEQTKATYKGLMDRDSGKKRPFVLTRAHFTGTQRYAAVWTGENTASWYSLKAGYQTCLSEALSGISFCGADVGGFFNDPDPELLQRWYQAGIWLPFFRAHAGNEAKRREPYMFPEEVQNRIRAAIKQRYAHIPTWYTLFYEHYRTGEPIIRPLFYEYPTDPQVFDIDDQLLVGKNILVKAVSEPSIASVPVYFPGDQDTIWYDLQNNVFYCGASQLNVDVNLDAIPVFYKSGSVIVRKDTSRRNTYEMRADKYHLYIQLDKNGEANGTIYIDDNESLEYNDKKYTYLTINFKNQALGVSLIDKDATYPQATFTIDYVVISKPPKNNENCQIEGKPFEYEQEKISVTSDGVKLGDLALDLQADNLIRL